MLFSVIIPVFKVEAYLEECLDSVLKQTFQDYEVILVDDGSPDLCPRICDAYAAKDRRIHVIHQQNHGLSSARNNGIKTAQGEYLIFLDSDDVLCPNALNDLSCCTISQPDVVVTEYLPVDDPAEWKNRSLISFDGQINKQSIIKYVCEKKTHTWTAQQYVVRREFVEKYGLTFPVGYYHEDVFWSAIMFSMADRFSIFPDVWYLKRAERKGSIMNIINSKRTFDVISLVSLAQNSDKVQRLSAVSRKYLNNQLARAAFSGLVFYGYYNRDDRNKTVRLVKENRDVFSHFMSARHRLFNWSLNTIGVRPTLEILGILAKMKPKSSL